MTAGSCSVAISRRRPPQWAHASTSMPKARCMRAAQVQAGGVDFPPTSPGPAARGAAAAVGPGSTRPVGDHGMTHSAAVVRRSP